MKCARAFTLVELLVVIALVAVLVRVAPVVTGRMDVDRTGRRRRLDRLLLGGPRLVGRSCAIAVTLDVDVRVGPTAVMKDGVDIGGNTSNV